MSRWPRITPEEVASLLSPAEPDLTPEFGAIDRRTRAQEPRFTADEVVSVTRDSTPAQALRPGEGMTGPDAGRTREVTGLIETPSRLPQIRRDRIEMLRHRIRSGTYRPDPVAVARAVVGFEDDFSLRG
ncbi:MAG: hypothetical protein GY716_15020 [bacterium]|nr:hypothetical protein [bacterium]